MIPFEEKDSCISKVLLRSNPRAISSARGSANHQRKNVPLRSVLLPIRLPISPNWEFRAHSTSVRSVISDSCPPTSVSQDNPPLPTRSRLSSLPPPMCQLSLASALFSYFSPKTEVTAMTSRLPPAMCYDAEKCCWAFTAGRNTTRETASTAEGKPVFY